MGMQAPMTPQGGNEQAPQQPVSPQPDVSGSSTMGVAPQQTQQAPAQQQVGPSPEQLSQNYTALQQQFTQQSQQLSEVQARYNQVVEYMLAQQQQQATQPQQQPTTRGLLDLEGEEFANAMAADPKKGIMTLAEQIANQKVNEQLSPLKQQMQATQMQLNRRAVDDTLANMQATYAKVDPNYQQNLQAAVEMTVGPLRSLANEDPAGALRMAYNTVLGQQLQNPAFVQQLQQSALQNQQVTEQQKQMAGLSVTNPGAYAPPNQPYNPQQINPQMQAQQIARQIATYSDPSSMSGLQGLQVTHNPF